MPSGAEVLGRWGAAQETQGTLEQVSYHGNTTGDRWIIAGLLGWRFVRCRISTGRGCGLY